MEGALHAVADDLPARGHVGPEVRAVDVRDEHLARLLTPEDGELRPESVHLLDLTLSNLKHGKK